MIQTKKTSSKNDQLYNKLHFVANILWYTHPIGCPQTFPWCFLGNSPSSLWTGTLRLPFLPSAQKQQFCLGWVTHSMHLYSKGYIWQNYKISTNVWLLEFFWKFFKIQFGIVLYKITIYTIHILHCNYIIISQIFSKVTSYIT